MRYPGGKFRLSKYIAPILKEAHTPGMPYLEPFMGGGSMMAQMHGINGMRFGSDLNSGMIHLFQMLAAGWSPPHFISEDHYKLVMRDDKRSKNHLLPDYYRAFIGHGSSWSGKLWAGYARDGVGIRNYTDEAARRLETMRPGMRDAILTVCDYTAWTWVKHATIYCDPPYRDTMNGYQTGDFDSDRFWRWCAFMAKNGNRVFVSEVNGPATNNCGPVLPVELVWEKEHAGGIRRKEGNPKQTEKLFRVLP